MGWKRPEPPPLIYPRLSLTKMIRNISFPLAVISHARGATLGLLGYPTTVFPPIGAAIESQVVPPLFVKYNFGTRSAVLLLGPPIYPLFSFRNQTVFIFFALANRGVLTKLQLTPPSTDLAIQPPEPTAYTTVDETK